MRLLLVLHVISVLLWWTAILRDDRSPGVVVELLSATLWEITIPLLYWWRRHQLRRDQRNRTHAR